MNGPGLGRSYTHLCVCAQERKDPVLAPPETREIMVRSQNEGTDGIKETDISDEKRSSILPLIDYPKTTWVRRPSR